MSKQHFKQLQEAQRRKKFYHSQAKKNPLKIARARLNPTPTVIAKFDDQSDSYYSSEPITPSSSTYSPPTASPSSCTSYSFYPASLPPPKTPISFPFESRHNYSCSSALGFEGFQEIYEDALETNSFDKVNLYISSLRDPRLRKMGLDFLRKNVSSEQYMKCAEAIGDKFSLTLYLECKPAGIHSRS